MQIVEAGNIRENMFALIIDADLVVLRCHRPQLRHALRKRRSVLIKCAPVTDAPPFDLLTDRYVPYQVNDPAAALPDLTAAIRATDRETNSPVFKMLNVHAPPRHGHD